MGKYQLSENTIFFCNNDDYIIESIFNLSEEEINNFISEMDENIINEGKTSYKIASAMLKPAIWFYQNTLIGQKINLSMTKRVLRKMVRKAKTKQDAQKVITIIHKNLSGLERYKKRFDTPAKQRTLEKFKKELNEMLDELAHREYEN
jgi:CRISPR/Cas system CSM-associated protein Csm2 small subunit